MKVVGGFIAFEAFVGDKGATAKMVLPLMMIKSIQPIYEAKNNLVAMINEPAPGKAAINLLDSNTYFVNHDVVEIADAIGATWLGNDRDKPVEVERKIEVVESNVTPITKTH